MDRVCHFQIPYSDKERAATFYKNVFGWQINDVPGEMPYSFAITTPVDEKECPTKAGGINGGMYVRSDDPGKMSNSPVVVIEVESCKQRIADIEGAGGSKISGPVEVPNKGIYAQVKDSEDNIIGLWQPLQPPAQ
ncbi:MAG: hypothetical protein M2R45_00860 [Verrucomicrobia subdivision 3 bacterium]|nr:hypothetical protein [Limisphaerales bacterium]MCS1414528.1 hypothetical protein [Limisphaerales bacterium]